MRNSFLLINGTHTHYWLSVLCESLETLGTLSTVKASEVKQLVMETKYDIILVDTTSVKNELALIAQLRSQQPDAKIIVVSASPTWKRARAAFRAGAVDYISKSTNAEELRSIFTALLA